MHRLEYFRCPSTWGFSLWFWCQFVDHHHLGTRWVRRHRCFKRSLCCCVPLEFLQHHLWYHFPKKETKDHEDHSTARLDPCNQLTFQKFRYFQVKFGANRRCFRSLGLNSFGLPNHFYQYCSRRKLVERLQFQQWIFLPFVLRLPFESAYIMHGPVAARSVLDSEKRSSEGYWLNTWSCAWCDDALQQVKPWLLDIFVSATHHLVDYCDLQTPARNHRRFIWLLLSILRQLLEVPNSTQTHHLSPECWVSGYISHLLHLLIDFNWNWGYDYSYQYQRSAQINCFLHPQRLDCLHYLFPE